MAKRQNTPPDIIKIRCFHCGNVALHGRQFSYIGTKQLEQDLERPYLFLVFKCTTCDCLAVFGEFEFYLTGASIKDISRYNQLYPKTPDLGEDVPERVSEIYKEVSHLRHQAPNAFANQIRRALEAVCVHQKADGDNLYKKLDDLAKKGKLPGHFRDFRDLIRIVGNIGSHASKHDIDTEDAELLNDFFLIIIEYIYIAPAKIKTLRRSTSRKIK